MKQTIEIEVPDGKKAVWKDNKVIFEDIKPQLPKTWEEFCRQNKIEKNECYLDACSCIEKALIRERCEDSDRNVLPNKQVAEQHLVLMQLHQLRDCYRQGWEPNWNDNYDKYIIISLLTYVNRFLTWNSVPCHKVYRFFMPIRSILLF